MSCPHPTQGIQYAPRLVAPVFIIYAVEFFLCYPSISEEIEMELTFFSLSSNPLTLLKPLTSKKLPILTHNFSSKNRFSSYNSNQVSKRLLPCCTSFSTATLDTRGYEFTDGVSEVELRLQLDGNEVPDIFVDADGTCLTVKLQQSRGASLVTLLETNHLYDQIKPAETIWYIDEDQLVINLKKHDPDLKWPDIIETWESLTTGVGQVLKGSSLYIVGESTKINQNVAKELAVGLGYTPLNTSELLESIGERSIDSWVIAEGVNSVAESEGAILESLSSHVRAVVATLGGVYGAASNSDKWRHLYSGFTIWLSESETTDEDSAREEARKQIKEGSRAYSNADVVVKLGGWDPDLSQTVAQACLSALKKLILSDKKLPGKKSLYIRLGCRGDWPNIEPPGWDPSGGTGASHQT